MSKPFNTLLDGMPKERKNNIKNKTKQYKVTLEQQAWNEGYEAGLLDKGYPNSYPEDSELYQLFDEGYNAGMEDSED